MKDKNHIEEQNGEITSGENSLNETSTKSAPLLKQMRELK